LRECVQLWTAQSVARARRLIRSRMRLGRSHPPQMVPATMPRPSGAPDAAAAPELTPLEFRGAFFHEGHHAFGEVA
jgi:hypothetical protein